MMRFEVSGMSCAACSARVEKAVKGVSGVESCSVNLLTGDMSVTGTADEGAIISAVKAAGYGARVKGSAPEAKVSEPEKIENPVIKRLIASAIILLPLMYVSMGHTMWGWWLPSVLSENCVGLGILQMLLSLTVMIINKAFFINGIKGLLRGAPNMDTLVALGSGASFIYSVAMLFSMSAAAVRGDITAAHGYLHEFYFESAAMILVLITVGKTLEAMAKGKTTSAIRGLMDLTPKTATVIRDGKEAVIPTEELYVGDVFVLRPGDSIPADAVVIEGESAVNESALTGESVPVDKKAGDRVSSATVNLSGYLKCRATEVGEDTAIAAVIRLVNDAVSTKAPIAKIADKVSGIFVPAVMGIALITAAAWLLWGAEFGFALARGISVLVISCPCALGLATPVAIMVGSGIGAREGILFKTAESLELCGRAKCVVFDKTGTVTRGTPEVTDVLPYGEYKEAELIALASGIEVFSEHPLALAVREYADKMGMTPREVTDFTALSGSGVKGVCDGRELLGGSLEFINGIYDVNEEIKETAKRLRDGGKTPLIFTLGGELVGAIAVADSIKNDAKAAVTELREMGVKVVMLTGDNERTAKAIAKAAGIDEVIADVKPDGKEAVIRALSKEQKTVMVGDGINDAPALTRADVGIAMARGTDIAIESADVVLVGDRLSGVPTAIRLGRKVLKNIKENLFWAFFYNAAGIPLAAGAFISLLGWQLNPMFGAAAMSLSSFCVVTNALRLYLFFTGCCTTYYNIPSSLYTREPLAQGHSALSFYLFFAHRQSLYRTPP